MVKLLYDELSGECRMEITLFKEEDVWGDSALEVIQAYGTRTGISDAALVLGTFVGYGSSNSAGVTSG